MRIAGNDVTANTATQKTYFQLEMILDKSTTNCLTFFFSALKISREADGSVRRLNRQSMAEIKVN